MKSNIPPQSGTIAFGEFLAYLRAKGFTVGVDQHLRLQRLLSRIEGGCAPGQVKTLLCPIFAASRAEQQEFYRAFDEFFAILREVEAPVAPVEPDTPIAELPPEKIAQPRRRAVVYTALVLLALTIAAWLGRERIRSGLTASTPATPTPEPIFTPTPMLKPASTLEFVKTETLSEPISSPTPIIQVAPDVLTTIAPQQKQTDWVLDHAWRLRLGALLPPILLFMAWQLWRWWRRRPVAERMRGRRPPFTWPIKLQKEEQRLDHSQTFYQAARGLRRRQPADHSQLDLERTIEATVAARGYPAFQFRQASRVPEYLVLIDRASRHDHQAQLFDQLAQSLERDGLFLARYFYDGDPRICRPALSITADAGRDVFLADLFRKHSGHRLILMGDGARLLDPVTGDLNEWTEMLIEWPERAILTPAPFAAWLRRERVLSRHFTLLPATLAGMAELADHYESPLRIELPRGGDASNDEAPPDTEYGVTVEQLRHYLGQDGFRWLCATAVYPELQWDLTVKLGELALAGNPFDEALLWRLLRLPWFRQGTIPDEPRLALVRALDPELDRTVRRFLVETLESNPAEQGTFAADERCLDIAVQKAYLAGDDRLKRKAAIKEIEHLQPGELQHDYTLIRLLEERPTSLLALVLPIRLRKLFYPEGLSHFGMKWQAALVLALITSLSLWGSTEGLIKYRKGHQPKPTPTPQVLPTPTPTPDIGLQPSTTEPTVNTSDLLRQRKILSMLTMTPEEVEKQLKGYMPPGPGSGPGSAPRCARLTTASISYPRPELSSDTFIDGFAGTITRTIKDRNGHIVAKREYKRPDLRYRPPEVVLNVAEMTACQGLNNSIQLKAVGTGGLDGGLVYSWSCTGGKIIGEATDTVFDTTGLALGDYTITVQVDDGCGRIAFDSKTIRVTNCPIVTACFGPSLDVSLETINPVKSGDIVTLKVIVVGGRNYGNLSYSWTASSGKIKDNGLFAQLDTSGVAGGTIIEITVLAKSDYGNCGASGSTRVAIQSEK